MMSKQVTSSGYTAASRRFPMIMGAKCRQRSVAGILEAPAKVTRKASADAAETSAWLQRRRVHAGGDLNGDVVAVLAHELRNSLSVIRMATGIWKTEPSASSAVEKARTLIEHQTDTMSRLVADLFETSRGHSANLTLKCQSVNLCVVAEQALQSVEVTMQQRRHCVTVSMPVSPLWLQGDPARLEQVFVNLLLNAAKYTPAGGMVRLCVECEEGEAVVRICDNGIGIAADVLPRVFDLFVQADPSPHRADAGLGIGLAVVRNLIERHGGCVTAESRGLGQGCEFAVRLPMPSGRDLQGEALSAGQSQF
jgi:signal transduction histidine kinase